MTSQSDCEKAGQDECTYNNTSDVLSDIEYRRNAPFHNPVSYVFIDSEFQIWLSGVYTERFQFSIKVSLPIACMRCLHMTGNTEDPLRVGFHVTLDGGGFMPDWERKPFLAL